MGVLADWKHYEELKRLDIMAYNNANIYVDKTAQDLEERRRAVKDEGRDPSISVFHKKKK